jgi:hypothetical protein
MTTENDPQQQLEWLKSLLMQINPNLIGGSLTVGTAPPNATSKGSSSREETSQEIAPVITPKEESNLIQVKLFAASSSEITTNARKAKKAVKACHLDNQEGFQDYKRDMKRSVPDSERKRINDLKEVYKQIKPLVKVTELASKQKVEQGELFSVLVFTLQSLLRFLSTEVRTAAYCQEYSLEPKKFAPKIRDILELYTSRSEQADQVCRIHESQQRDKSTLALEHALRKPGGQAGNYNKENHNPRWKDNKDHHNPKFNPKKKAVAQGEATAKDV